MTSKNYPKLLIVEGEQDKRVIPELMEKNDVAWPNEKRPVHIQVYGGDRLFNQPRISSWLKQQGIQALGIVIDADDNLSGRWESIKNVCTPLMPDFPKELPETGLIHTTPNRVKFGVWIMPDNQSRGMLETFLTYLISNTGEPIWNYAKEATQEARDRGAPFIEKHTDKANIHTWLAWQNKPGKQIHNAITAKIFEPTHPKAQIFVNWFKTLYDLEN